MIIDCDTCDVRGKECGDCVVSFLTIPVRAPERREVMMDEAQAAAVDALVQGGLVPPLRLVTSVAQDMSPQQPIAPPRSTRAS